MTFQNELVKWYLINKRDLPWRNTDDPYVIWLSEVILQQTRVEQGMPYFFTFLEHYPTVIDFANASEEHILKHWQGLGYYSRGRNMLHTAREVRDYYQGIFPSRYEDLIKLKGIGEYTAAAISSFSANESRAVVDGNVFRVLARYFGINTAINTGAGKKEFSSLAQQLIVGQQPSLYNQAIMEFGALQCKPRNPDCPSCPLNLSCYARQHDLISVLPVKVKKSAQKIRYFNYFICKNGDQILINHRGSGDIWQHLYDFPLIETSTTGDDDLSILPQLISEMFGNECIYSSLMKTKHVLTHQIIYLQFFVLNNYIFNFNNNTNIKWVTREALDQLPQPKVIASFIKDCLNK